MNPRITLARDIDAHLLRAVSDPAIHAWLEALGVLPLPAFEAWENEVYAENKPEGFCVVVRKLKDSPSAPVVHGCFFYNEDQEGYRRFPHALPRDITFADNAQKVVERLGPPSIEHRSKKTGKLQGYRYKLDDENYVSVSFVDDGALIDHVYRGTIAGM